MFLNFFFQPSTVVSLLAESCRKYDRRFHTRIDTLSNNLRHCLRRGYHKRKVNASGNVADAFLRFDAEDFSVAGIDGVNSDGKLALQKIRNHAAANGSSAIGGSDHGHRTRAKQRLQPRACRSGWSVKLVDVRGHGGN